MGMFQKPKTKVPDVPKGAKVTFAVRYRSGRKSFDSFAEARDLAMAEKAAENGWAEVTRVIEEVVIAR